MNEQQEPKVTSPDDGQSRSTVGLERAFDAWMVNPERGITAAASSGDKLKAAFMAGANEEGYEVLKTMLEVYDILDDPAMFRTALADAVARRGMRANFEGEQRP